MRTLIAVIERFSTPVLTLCALVMTILVVRTQWFPPPPPPLPEPVGYLKGKVSSIALRPDSASLRLVGDRGARRIVVEFADFQCPFCAKAAQLLHASLQRNPSALAIEFHHMPLGPHPFARGAALASECAAEQGQFAALYFVLYENQSKLGQWSWLNFAKKAGVRDLARFGECVASERYAQRVDDDTELAQRLDIGGTPAWVLGDSVFAGTPSVAQLNRWMHDSLGATRSSLSLAR